MFHSIGEAKDPYSRYICQYEDIRLVCPTGYYIQIDSVSIVDRPEGDQTCLPAGPEALYPCLAELAERGIIDECERLEECNITAAALPEMGVCDDFDVLMMLSYTCERKLKFNIPVFF